MGVPISAERETEPQREYVTLPQDTQQGGIKRGTGTQICLNPEATAFPSHHDVEMYVFL